MYTLNNFRILAVVLVSLGLTACVAPQSIVTQPVSARPQQTVLTQASNGSIFQSGTAKLLFEEPNARRVGDILIIAIEESLSAVNSANSAADRSGSLKLSGTTDLPYMPSVLNKMLDASADVTSANTFAGKGQTNSSNTFRGTIAVTVVDVLSNGNLVFGGEKQIAVNGQTSLIRFTGVVNPADIRAGNTVSSTRVADARIEQVGQGAIADANTMGWMQRAFLSVWPF